MPPNDNVTHSHTSDQQSSPRQNYGRNVDLAETQRFLKLLGAKSCTFQTFDDEPDRKLAKGAIAKIMHGDLTRHAETLKQLNRQGAGIFMAVNETDRMGRKKENIKRIRAVVLDLDGEPLAPVLQCSLKPHVIVETSERHYHVYWRVKGFPKEHYEDIQRGLAKRFDGDPAVALLTFCARLPGFSHCKREAFRVRIVESGKHKAYTFDEISGAFPPEKKPHKAPKSLQGRILLSRDSPMLSAQKFAEHMISSDRAHLRFYRGALYRWTGTHYTEVAPKVVRSMLYEFLHTMGATRDKKSGALQPFNPRPANVNEIIDCLEAGVHEQVRMVERDAPFWIEGSPHAQRDPNQIVACRNGLLDLKTRELLPHDPLFFNVNCLPFDYDAEAKAPQWNRFLRDLWPGNRGTNKPARARDRDDKRARLTLGEIFGLMLTPDTSFHKIFCLIGPPRAGKGTLARLLTELLGNSNVGAPSMNQLTTQFGLQDLTDKRLAIVGDARLGKNTDRITERLLSISGGDKQQVDIKYRAPWSGYLSLRFVILTNELPRIPDMSGTLPKRFVLLMLRNSFLGKEDLQLTDKLKTELPGILNWALHGLDRLRKRGYFEMPQTSLAAMQMLDDLASPVRAFVREWCDLAPKADADGRPIVLRENVKALWSAYQQWCQMAGETSGSQVVFGRNLKAAFPQISISGRNPDRYYRNLRLTEAGVQQSEVGQRTSR